MHSSLFKFTLALNSEFLFWKLFEFLMRMSENILFSMSQFLTKCVPVLDALQLLMLFAGTLTYLEINYFLNHILYIDTSLLLLLLFSPYYGWFSRSN
jgi:hypothetical protein